MRLMPGSIDEDTIDECYAWQKFKRIKIAIYFKITLPINFSKI